MIAFGPGPDSPNAANLPAAVDEEDGEEEEKENKMAVPFQSESVSPFPISEI